MQTGIKYNGFSASPSDYECKDGDMSAIMGLIPDEGNLKPLLPPKELFTLEKNETNHLKDYSVMLKHDSNSFDGSHYILLNGQNKVAWCDSTGVVKGTIGTFDDVVINNFNTIGNTVLMLTNNGMYYFLWKDDTYIMLGNHIPELPVSFGLQAEIVRSEQFGVSFSAVDSVLSGLGNFNESDYNSLTSAILAKVNKFIAEEATNKGKFIHPFFVRYAYRLYDGTLTMHSAPILMITSSEANPCCIVDHYNMLGTSQYQGAYLYIYSAVHSLDYAIYDAEALASLKNWNDIVKSIDIFISKPINIYDPNGQVKSFVHNHKGGYGLFIPTSYRDIASDTTTNVFGRYHKYYMSDMYDYFVNRSEYFGRRFIKLPERDEEEVRNDFESCHLFYLLHSIDLEKVEANDNSEANAFLGWGYREGRTIVPIKEDYLEALTAREYMDDDYDSHDSLYPKSSFGYNSRLNITGLDKKLFAGYNAIAMFPHTNGYYTSMDNYGTVGDMTVYFCIRQDGRDIWTKGGTGKFSFTEQSSIYIYHPNSNAVKAVVVPNYGSGKIKEYELKKHEHLNGAYYFNGFDEVDIIDGDYPTLSPDNKLLISIPNKIYTSEVNNPFVFPVSGINTIGIGSIISLSTASKALSQGQFGQFPLYAFATDGVWALEVSSSGGFSSKQPITRDVCISADSITQLDSSVLFATDRGIIMLSGSNSTCLTDALDDNSYIDYSSLPHIQDIVSKVGYSSTNLQFVPFRTFLDGSKMTYAYARQQIILYNPDYSYAYVFSMKDKMWSMMLSDIKSNVNSYPQSICELKSGKVVDYSSDDGTSTGLKGLFITRPIKFDNHDVLKTVDCIISRGTFKKGHMSTALYGSRDMVNWELVWTSVDHYLRGFHGTPYKYFRIVGLSNLDKNESIYGASVNLDLRQRNHMK